MELHVCAFCVTFSSSTVHTHLLFVIVIYPLGIKDMSVGIADNLTNEYNLTPAFLNDSITIASRSNS